MGDRRPFRPVPTDRLIKWLYAIDTLIREGDLYAMTAAIAIHEELELRERLRNEKLDNGDDGSFSDNALQIDL